MNSNRKIARVVGILFIAATVTGIISVTLIGTNLETPIDSTGIASNQFQILAAAFFLVIMAFTCAGIAIALYPVIKKENEGLAIGAVGFRIIEAVFHLISATVLIVLVKLCLESGSAELINFKPFSIILKSLHDGTYNLGLMAFTIGALLYNVIFLQSGLIPKWLSIWGIIGVILTFILTALILFNNEIPEALTGLFNFPIAIQEMVLAVWLILKGFNQPATK